MSLNVVSSATTVAVALAAGLAGYGLGGPLGAVLGFGVGLSACGRYLKRNRFYRA